MNTAYEAGYLAWWDERTPKDCPYPIPGGRATEWLRGFADAEAEFAARPNTEPEFEIGEPVG